MASKAKENPEKPYPRKKFRKQENEENEKGRVNAIM